MPIPAINLNDENQVIYAEGGKSPAFFCNKYPVKVHKKLITELKMLSLDQGGKNIRLCMHENPQAPFHDMLILAHKGKYYPPHKHETKGESFHIIEGLLAVFTFTETGEIMDACILEKEGNFIYKVGINMVHVVMPLSGTAVYHESRPGPFLGEKDSTIPSWTPDGNDLKAINQFQEKLMHELANWSF